MNLANNGIATTVPIWPLSVVIGMFAKTAVAIIVHLNARRRMGSSEMAISTYGLRLRVCACGYIVHGFFLGLTMYLEYLQHVCNFAVFYYPLTWVPQCIGLLFEALGSYPVASSFLFHDSILAMYTVPGKVSGAVDYFMCSLSAPPFTPPMSNNGVTEKMIRITPLSRQPVREAWTLERLNHECSILLGMAIDHSTALTYTLALNSYLTFCKIHTIPVDPTPKTLSYYMAFQSSHINPKSVDSYLSGIYNQLETFYPDV